MRVIGTAGHVDHGKSALVQALTGTHPDRLKEEREREMTIDLGFAWFNLPSGEPVGVIDVPGHRDFIENMLAGVGGIDAALFVVAADEGVMPQTREHLAILDLLAIPTGVIVLTKADLVDAEWIELMTAEVRQAVRGTVLEAAPLVPVSARTGAGLEALKRALADVLAAQPKRPDLGRPRLPIDRVFSLTGFGTIVTGTLSDGAFALGETVEIMPGHLEARIRGLQTHKTKLERAVPGSRVALNLSGVEVNQLRRGMVVAHPGTLQATTLLDAHFRHLPDADLPLKHNAEVKLFVGSAEVRAAVRLLGCNELPPGESAWIQLICVEPIVATKDQRFILRRPSPGATIGGGVVIDPQPRRRYRQHDKSAVMRLETAARGSPGEILLQALEALGVAPLREAIAKAGLEPALAADAVSELRAAGSLVELEGEALAASRATWSSLADELQRTLAAYHAQFPLKAGMPREELKSRLAKQFALTSQAVNAVLAHAEKQGLIAAQTASVRLSAHTVTFTPDQQVRINALLADLRRDPYNTPLPKDCAARVGEEVFAALVELGRLVQVSPEVVFLSETYAQMVECIKAQTRTKGKITVAEVRDLFKTSRKYALALLEHLDAIGVTRRLGDERILRDRRTTNR
ncbi:MAG: selenocysteine-specific translation elongation factor [Anaerolineales bacterium]|nr:selenocysteine-specific translation elongation factor [Anaerolineales bacterium]